MKRVISILALMACLLAGCASNTKDGVTFLEEGKYEEAITCFEKDLQEEKNLDEAYRGMGIAYFEMGNYQLAVEAFENALKNEAKENATIYSFLGAGYLQLDNYEEALENYGEALKQEDCTTEMKQEILFNEIAIYQEMGEWDIVKEKVESYVENYPDDVRMDKTVEFLKTR